LTVVCRSLQRIGGCTHSKYSPSPKRFKALERGRVRKARVRIRNQAACGTLGRSAIASRIAASG
jgi:hypothetical protein